MITRWALILIIMGCLGGLAIIGLTKKVDSLVLKTNQLIEGQRLSTILRLEPASLKVSPEIFEANKPKVLTRLLAALENEQHPQPSTLAYCILQHSGFGSFVDGKTFEAAKTALARLIVNEDKDEARNFLEELVDKL